MAASTYFKRFRSIFRGYGDILTGFIVGAGLTKIYFESRAQTSEDTYSKNQIRRIINSHDNLKWGRRLRTISVHEDKIIPQNYGFQEDTILKYGLPEKATDEIMYKNHALCYDRAKKTPRWVAQHLTRDRLTGEAERGKCDFKPDLNIPPQFQARNEDYLGSGWSRGHMTAASDHRFDQESMNETFYLTNIVPQNFDNNGGFWYRMESYCRHLTRCYSDVYVISGPLYLPHVEENGSKFTRYQVIGENNVAVPTHLYKVILAEAQDKPSLFGAFVVPNEPIGYDCELRDFQVPLEKLEKDSGLVFFPNCDTSSALDLCDTDGCKLMSQEMMKMIVFGRKLRNSATLDDLESLWMELKDKGVKPDKFTVEIYEKRKAEVIDSSENVVSLKLGEGKQLERETKPQCQVLDDRDNKMDQKTESVFHKNPGDVVSNNLTKNRNSQNRTRYDTEKDVIIIVDKPDDRN